MMVRFPYSLRRCGVMLMAAAGVLAGATLGFAADDDQSGSSFLSPFPEGDVYRLAVIGDTFAEGIQYPLFETFADDNRLKVERRVQHFSSLAGAEFDQALRDLDASLLRDPADIAVIMMGEDDLGWLRIAGAKRLQPATPEWRTEFARRVDLLMKAMRRRGISVYWAGLPIMARNDADEIVQAINEIIRERSYLNGVRYIDAYAGFSDETGNYSAYGPDLTGKIRVLRSGNGTYFTDAGNRKLAHFAEKELRRDLKQAKSERAVPLAGDEAEQARVRPVKAEADDKSFGPSGSLASMTTSNGQANGPAASAFSNASGDEGVRDQTAETSKIEVRSIGTDGRETKETIEIVRPTIPASVVAAMTRRENARRATQMGDLIIDQIAGGLTVMTSITPANTTGGERNKVSLTQSPSFRLLVKGERLTPKAGRADDFTWPRPEAANIP